MSKRIAWFVAVLALVFASASPAFAAGSSWAQKQNQCRHHLESSEKLPPLTAQNVCQGDIQATQATDITLNSIDQAAFDIARRVRKYIYGGKLPSAFNRGAPTLFFAAVMFLFVWYGYQIIFVSSDDRKGTTYLISTLLKAILFGSILMWLMYAYIPTMKSVDAGINWLSSLFLNQTAPPGAQSGLAAYITYGTQSFVGITVKFFNLKPGVPATPHWYDFAPYFEWIKSMVLWFFPLVLLIIEMILFVGLGILAQILFALGVAFGPLMLVLSVLPFARRLAQSWGNFLLSAGFYKLVLAAIVGLGGIVFIQSIKLLTTLQKHLSHQGLLGAGHYAAGLTLYRVLIFAAVCLLLFALILAMFSASRIANHLITGFGTFDIGTAGAQGGPNVSRGDSNDKPDRRGTDDERNLSPTQTDPGNKGGDESSGKDKAAEGPEGERGEAPTATLDPNETPVGEDEAAPGADSDDTESPQGIGAEDDSAPNDASPSASTPSGDEVDESGDTGSGSDTGVTADRGPVSDDEGLPTSDEEPPPPDDSEIPPEPDDETRDPTV